MMGSDFLILVLVTITTTTFGFKQFQQKIPNGDRVPHPCKPNYIWQGVGHENEKGGGVRNPFGQDFEANGKKWDATLCQKDSDGDGKTNGAELGDPDCTWKENDVPTTLTGLTHPGICDPYDSEQCKGKNDWVSCDVEEFKCDNLAKEGAVNLTLKIDRTKVPGEETTYICQSFAVPSDKDYHMIAAQPHIDNAYVMHHMDMYGCPDSEAYMKDQFASPKTCSMAVANCKLIAGWTLGAGGDCFEESYGILLGKNGFKFIILELHWNNPELKNDYYDSSGMSIHYTANLRPYDASILTIGPMSLEIPPGLNEHEEESTCKSECTSLLNETVYLINANIHMHYLGKSGVISQYRKGNKVKDIAVDEAFAYDSPVFHVFEKPIEIQPGDELRLSCVFSSKYKKETTYYGEGTAEEMCFGFFTYYPARTGFNDCTSFRSLNFCEIAGDDDATRIWESQGCDYEKFEEETEDDMEKLYTDCDDKKCTTKCEKAIDSILKHPCLKGDIHLYDEFEAQLTGNQEDIEFYEMLRICEKDTSSLGSVISYKLEVIAVMIFCTLFSM